MGKTHRVGAVFLAFPMILPVFHLTGTSSTDAAAITFFLGGSLLAARLPDLDHPCSAVSRKLWLISWLISVFHAFCQFIYVLTMRKLKFLKRLTRASGHRGISHTFFFWILFCLMLAGIYSLLGNLLPRNDFISHKLLLFFFGLAFGYLTHLLLDFISGTLRPYEPFSNRKCGKKIIPTNSKQEIYLRKLLFIADIFLLIKTYDFLYPSLFAFINQS